MSSEQNKFNDQPSQVQLQGEHVVPAEEELDVTVIDLSGDRDTAVELLRMCCSSQGVFMVINHGVDAELVRAAEEGLANYFKLPQEEEKKTPDGDLLNRSKNKLSWKETFTCFYHAKGDGTEVVDSIKSALGDEFESIGWTYQRYTEAMVFMCMSLLELLAISLGLDREYYRKFYEDNESSLRYHFHPPCENPSTNIGTGPHTDPTSLTVLHQDQVGGIEFFVDNKWKFVRPRKGAFIINIGDTFMAQTNGIYKSCWHRAIVNSEKERISIPFFLNPEKSKVVKPHELLVSTEHPRKYPDFTWSDYTKYILPRYYKHDINKTLKDFMEWFQSPDNVTP